MSLPSLPQVLDAARAWSMLGVSALQIRPDGSKRPAVKWAQYTIKAPTLEEVFDWFGNGTPYGLALIMGAVSGGLEMTELEGAVTQDHILMNRIFDKLDEHDAWDVWDLLYYGYHETSPTGGIHLIYRITDHAVPGNEKIARRPVAEPQKVQVLAETRGEGGYVIVAPTTGLCHPSGKPWVLQYGEAGKVPEITWEQRELVHRVLREALDEMPPQDLVPVPSSPPPSLTIGTKPGDDFEAQTSWEDILMPHGWEVLTRRGQETHWVRPGKDRREGMSATTGHAGDRDRLFVFSTSTVFPSETPITKFHAYALLNFHGDHSAAAKALVRLGFGDRPVDPDEMMSAEIAVNATSTAVIPAEVVEPERPRTLYRHDDVGNARRLWDTVRGRYVYVDEYSSFFHWSGKRWERDYTNALHREQMKVIDAMYEEADRDDNPALRKWAKQSAKIVKATCSLVSSMEGATVRSEVFDTHQDLLNVGNGILNLTTGELLPHDPKYMMTRMFGADYDPSAQCPNFEQFMADVLPDESMRAYVQRAIGYTLLGRADQRAMFLIHGPSGTGKSTLMETLRLVFGDYGTTAPAGTFKIKREGAPNNDLHTLRGKRFVSTSETSETAVFDEDTLKRITGRDSVRSRALYQEYEEWTPECSLWLATNHPPRFTTDDDAIWRRAKLIPFLTQFVGEGEIADMARTRLAPEASGILNWILAGLRDFLTHGLGEPEEVRSAAAEQRQMSDPVARFMDDMIESGRLAYGQPTDTMRITELRHLYVEWCKMSGERPMSMRRFNMRPSSGCLPGVTCTPPGTDQKVWFGLRRGSGAGIMGTM